MIVLFDLDGTLIDSVPDIHATACEVLTAAGLSPVTLTEVRGFVGRGLPALVDSLLAAQGADPALAAAMVSAFAHRYETAVTRTHPYPGAAEALAALRRAGHRLGLCTNKPLAPTRALLAHLGWSDLFTAVVGGDSLPQRKPDPAPVWHARDLCGAGPAVFVGDSEVDAEAAAAAGLPLLLFTGGYRKAPVSALTHAAAFDHHQALPGLIAGLA